MSFDANGFFLGVINSPDITLLIYVCFFFTWGLWSNIDFITAKWRSIKRTRHLAKEHWFVIILTLVYVGMYAEAQRRAKDWKELGSTLAAIGVVLVHTMRTMMGEAQLSAFTAWCKHAVQCVHALQSEDDDNSTENDDVERNVLVNNTIVDNELAGSDVTIVLSLPRMCKRLMRGEYGLRAGLMTCQPILCTVRWSGALLCGLGEKWTGDVLGDHRGELVDLFFSPKLETLRKALQSVTWKIGGGAGGMECDSKLLCIERLAENSMAVDSGLALGHRRDDCSFGSYSFELNNLSSLYPDFRGLRNREKVHVGLVESIVLTKRLGVENLKAIRCYYDRYNLPSFSIQRDAVQLLLKQLSHDSSNGSNELALLSNLSKIPIFPYRMQMVALWDEATNWRVLQASAHTDIKISSSDGIIKYGKMSSLQDEVRPVHVFDIYEKLAKEVATNNPGFVGVVLETVRTFLAEWLTDGGRNPNWEPVIPTKSFEFVLKGNFRDICYADGQFLTWACQHALQKELAVTFHTDEKLCSNPALIMLFVLGLPDLTCENINEIEACSPESSGMHTIIDMSKQVWCLSTKWAPQDIFIVLHHDLETNTVSLKLQNGDKDSRFIWQNWVDAAMGCLKGFEKCADEKMKCNRTIVRAILGGPIVELCPLSVRFDDSVRETKTVRIWTGWPPFDVRICKFEVEQWLAARDISMNSTEFGKEGDTEVTRAEQFIAEMLSGMNEDK